MLLRLLVSCALLSMPGAAFALTTINFDTLPGGGTPVAFALVGDAYASLGVHFGS